MLNNNSIITIRQQILNNRNTVPVSVLSGSDQEKDLSKPPNCRGIGRIHHFTEFPREGWIADPLPMYPAAAALKLKFQEVREAQVFQIAVCNLRCWYCFVDYSLLSVDSEKYVSVSAEDMLDRLATVNEGPKVLDLSGGNPGLMPEWVLWTVRALRNKGLSQSIFLWVDDNLTVNIYGTVLTAEEISEISEFDSFGMVGCFKGYDKESFRFNTGSSSISFSDQFKTFKSLFDFNWDIYGYVTFTTPNTKNIEKQIACFYDRLQDIDENLPLRIVPLEIIPFTPTKPRMKDVHKKAIINQYEVLEIWKTEKEKRFNSTIINTPVNEVKFITTEQ